jgi:diacylglycerol kinase (ATP)
MTDGPREKPAAKSGLAHLVAALGYSLDGARRLWREASFRQEVLAFLTLAAVFAVAGASVTEYVGLAVLSLIVLAVEALNTAIEELVDNASPGWSEFAKAAKDMGSFAVMCVLLATGIYAAWVVFL